MASRWVGRAWVRLLAARGVRPVCVPANAWVGILSVGPPTGIGATPPCSPTRTLSLSWAGRVFSLCEFVGREERGACELGALSCREAWSRGPGGGSKRSRTVARSQWVVFAEAGLGLVARRGPRRGPGRVLGGVHRCRRQISLLALCDLPWGRSVTVRYLKVTAGLFRKCGCGRGSAGLQMVGR